MHVQTESLGQPEMFSDITSWDREGEEKREVGREGGKNSSSKIELKSISKL